MRVRQSLDLLVVLWKHVNYADATDVKQMAMVWVNTEGGNILFVLEFFERRVVTQY